MRKILFLLLIIKVASIGASEGQILFATDEEDGRSITPFSSKRVTVFSSSLEDTGLEVAGDVVSRNKALIGDLPERMPSFLERAPSVEAQEILNDAFKHTSTQKGRERYVIDRAKFLIHVSELPSGVSLEVSTKSEQTSLTFKSNLPRACTSCYLRDSRLSYLLITSVAVMMYFLIQSNLYSTTVCS